MEFKKIKTKKQLAKEEGTPINYCLIKAKDKPKGKNRSKQFWETKLVYKQREENPSNDEYLISRFKKQLNIKEDKQIIITEIKPLIFLGYGTNEKRS